MDDELPGTKSIKLGLVLIGLAASLAALVSSGGLAIAAGVVGLACLGGSMVADFFPSDSPCERYWRECDEAQAIAADEPAVCQEQETGHGHHWRKMVTASRCGSRRR